MPSNHAPDKICVSAWVPRTLHRRLQKRARELVPPQTLTELVEEIYNRETRDVELTPDDYMQIAQDTEAARKKIDRRARAARAQSQAANQG